MTVKISQIVQTQLPEYVRTEYPLIGEFLRSYYLSQEFKGAPNDLIQNLVSYLRPENQTNFPEFTSLSIDLSLFDDVIYAQSTIGFPDSYGLIQIDDEIIVYETKTDTSFLGCYRGFSGISGFDQNELIFSESSAENHSKDTKIFNLSQLFLQKFFEKLKYQFLPGFENREFTKNLNTSLFLKQARDFYQSKGTDESFKILFRALYGENVDILRPKERMISPSNAQYTITNDFVVEAIAGNPLLLTNQTLFQDEYHNISKAYAPITKVEEILTNSNQVYYKLSIDSGYNRDITVQGATYGNFSIHAKTKLIGNVTPTSQNLTVDSTIGFPNSGELYVLYENQTEGVIQYASKTLNQFLNCTNITGNLTNGADIAINTYAYANVNGEEIRVRINSVLSDVKIDSPSQYTQKNDLIALKTLGIDSRDVNSESWCLNVSASYKVLNTQLIDSNNKIYQIAVDVPHIFRKNDPVWIIDSNSVLKTGSVINVNSNKSIQIRSDEILNINTVYKIQRRVSETSFGLVSDVQNIYKSPKSTLVASGSLPFYGSQGLSAYDHSVVFSGTFENTDTFTITSSSDHGFYTGDLIYYTPEKQNNTIVSSLFSEGLYYIQRIDSNRVKFAKSASDLQNQNYIFITNPITVSSNRIQLYKYRSKTLKSQKLLRKFEEPQNTGTDYSTPIGHTGMLVNGTEILNYKSADRVYYGKLNEILVTASGQNYDVIHPPVIQIQDSTGIGATAICAIEGSLQEIRILNSGYDFTEIPTVRITGGNGIGAKANAILRSIHNEITFNSESSSFVNLSNSTIGFSTAHRFKNGERVIYDSRSQQGIAGLTTTSSYYVSVKSDTVIDFHQNSSDALAGINTISLTSYGKGTQSIRSFNSASVLSSINIENSGQGYTNQIKTTGPIGINTALGIVHIPNHEFYSGEEIQYQNDSVAIGGLVSGNFYKISRIDENQFRLLNDSEQPIRLISSGSGTHVFKYPDIQVEIVGRYSYAPQIQPIFRGKIKSVHLTNLGTNYGSQNVLNYEKQPLITLNSGSGAQLTPIVSNGRIIDVLINNSGSNYNSPPNLIISGTGIGAILTPVISNGQIQSVNIIQGGIDYTPESTRILVESAGKGASFSAKIQRWSVNLFAKEFNNLGSDDGTLTEGLNQNYELEYSHLYAPRRLRDVLYARNKLGEIFYNQTDLSNDFTNSPQHSPIIGWAYDGNPIYGPYGYSKKSGGNVTQLKSGYVLSPQTNRPNFPLGFFVEDYVYNLTNDESTLDEHNGRFCITPEFPNGTYAYFATLESTLDSLDSNSPFVNSKRPKFPYLIGNSYASAPNQFNFIPSSNQDEIDLNSSEWQRNTYAYNLSEYSYLNIPNDLKQTALITFASPGSVNDVEIVSEGNNYRVNDEIVFENGEISAKVSRLHGKKINSISVATTSLYDVEFYGETVSAVSKTPHNLQNRDLVSISGLSTTTSGLFGSHQIQVVSNTLSLSSGISSEAITGPITYLNLSSYTNFSVLRENDIYELENESVQILNIDSISSRIRVLRESGGPAHSVDVQLVENTRRFKIPNLILKNNQSQRENREFYFNPAESLSIGTTGTGTTITFSNPGAGSTQIFAPIRSIYIPKHNLITGDSLIYSTNGGSSLQYSLDGSGSTSLPDQSVVYVGKISEDFIGISPVPIGIGSTGSFVGIASDQRDKSIVYFVGAGTGEIHSLKTQYSTITGKVSKNLVTVSTASTHGLQNQDSVLMNVISGISTTVSVKYDDYNRRMILNSRSFGSGDINISQNTIQIVNHSYSPGQKLIHDSNSPSGGLENHGIYYVVIVDENTISLSNSYQSAISENPVIIDITSASNGTLSEINSPITIHRNSTLIFDVSDSSLSYNYQSANYSAFTLEFYRDSTFNTKFEGSGTLPVFEITRTGTLGVSNNARITLSINENIPEKLYYKLNPISALGIPAEKTEIVVDDEVPQNNEIEILESLYNGNQIVSVASSTSFTYNLPVRPENTAYNTTNAILNYETNSRSAYGPIAHVDVYNQLKNLKILPGISSIISSTGSGAILNNLSSTIGQIEKTRLTDIGFDFPSDLTLRPTAAPPQIIQVEQFSSFDRIDVISFGRGYTSAPVLIVLDGKTNEIVGDVDIRYNIGNSKVEIYRNTSGINDVTPKIIPIQNTNGVGISLVSYNSVTQEVTLTLATEFSNLNDFPFEIGDKILVENVVSDGTGYNSSNYGYKLFTVTDRDPNIGGGNGTIKYSLADVLTISQSPGNFDSVNSVGRVIPEKYFPVFDIKLKKNSFIIGEKVISNSYEGYVLDWNENINYLTIISRNDFKVGSTIQGTTSFSKGLIRLIFSSKGHFDLAPYSRVESGWKTNVGFLNDDLQRIQDSDYYQAFSYSIKSRVDYETWRDVVSSLNHTAGFKKFADYELESTSSAGIQTYVSNCDVTNDLIGVVDLNCVPDFDLVSENYLSSGASDEITFSSKILTSYYQSIGNRVLQIDDISSQFGNYPGEARYAEIYKFLYSTIQAQKYFIYVRDRRFISQSQFSIVTVLHDHLNGYLNQYGTLNTSYNLGSYDFDISGTYGILKFYPTRYDTNNYDIVTVAYNLKDNISGVGSTSFGNYAKIQSSYTEIPTNSSGTIVGISSSMRSAKILAEISLDDQKYEFNELSLIHDGSNIQLLDYGQLTIGSSGIGTYYAYYNNSNINVDFIPTAGIGSTAIVNTIQVALASTVSVGSSSYDLKHLLLSARTTSIGSSTTPTATVIADYTSVYNSAYCMVQVSDLTNNIHQFSEIAILNNSQVYFNEFGNLSSANSSSFTGIGTFGTNQSTNTQLLFTPIPNIDVQVNVFMNVIRIEDDFEAEISFNNASIRTGNSVYYGTENFNRTSFDLTNKGIPIFQRVFNASDSNVVDLTNNTIFIPNHFFVSGEEISYSNAGTGSTTSIGIGTTTFAGIGSTDRLPTNVYAVKINSSLISLASSAENALKTIPQVLNLTQVGIGTLHSFTSKNQNTKALITIDNVIQSPINTKSTSYQLANNAYTTEDVIYFTGITSFFSGDLVKINDEIMRIESMGIGSTNGIRVVRSLMGTQIGFHTATTPIRKVYGNYNIIDNTLYFAYAPYGVLPEITTDPNETDWSGISTSSSFTGRVFIRSGVNDTSSETYSNNYIFDDISNQFDAVQNTFTLKQNNSDITGFYQNNGIIMINDVFQAPGSNQNYTLSETMSGTDIEFVGTSNPITYDVGISSFPRGGMIVSVYSTEGFGYHPLVSAGGTAVISGFGTVQSVSIGNSGSGYRSGLQTVRVGVTTVTTGTPKIEFIGTATVSNGHVVGIAITNPGIGYTFTNPPRVVFDDPLPYSDLPLIYDSSSSGSGSNATIDIVVGQGSSVINFEIKNVGHGYKENEILTIAAGTPVGIPTNTSLAFSPFKITVERTISDKFSGWTFGSLQLLDDVSSLFNGRRTTFPIRINGDLISIYSAKGSSINVQDNLLIFVNGVLQIPGKAYSFKGGSSITFSEAPKAGDSVKILFYRGTDPIDVLYKDILETVKPGDELTIGYDSFIGQKSYLQENSRTVSEIISLNSVNTLPYFGPGNTNNSSLLRPVVWCRQTEDKIINEMEINKTRGLYEASVIPTAYLIQSVGIGSTVIWIDSLRPLFNSTNESVSLHFQKKINLMSTNDNSPSLEESLVNTFEGDNGLIVGIGTTSVGAATTGIYFDLHIPLNSALRDSTITGVTTISGIQTGYYFSVYNSNIGNGVISLNSDNSVIGMGVTFLDNVYRVASVSYPTISVAGIGNTMVSRVIVSVSDYNGLNILNEQQYYGEFSWGKLILKYRKKNNQYYAYPVGISTGDIVTRIVPLKSSNYTS